MKFIPVPVLVLIVMSGSTSSAQVVRREIPLPQGVVQQWQGVRGLVTRMVEKMPAEYYDFRPTPEMRTFAANVAHLIQSNINQCGNLMGRRHALAGQPIESTLTQKADVVNAWKSSVEFCNEYFDKLTTVSQLGDQHFETTGKNAAGQAMEFKAAHGVVVSALLVHSNEMYGYMAVYMRLKGLVPPSSERPPAAPAAPAPTDATAIAVLSASIDAMGGQAVLEGVRALSLTSIGHQWALEQSERPEGPWLSTYIQRKEVRDIAGRRRSLGMQRRDWNFPEWSPSMETVVANGVAARRNGDRWFGGAPFDLTDFENALALEPERLLLTAKAAANLTLLPDSVEQGVNQRVLSFTHAGRSHRLLLNAWTGLPTMLETIRHDDMWGDVTERRWFSYWTLQPGGLMYPRQTTTQWNGLPYADSTVHAIVVNPVLDEAVFAIPEDARKAFEATRNRQSGMSSLTLDESRVAAINEWVTQVPGGFNVAFVKQPDGLVVFEATTTSAYSASVLALAEKRYPGVPIKAVVTTSDAWPHVSGIREYAAREIPIYALDLNLPILSRLIAAPRTMSPDAQARAPKAPKFTAVGARTTIGSGNTRIELVPVRGETGERMMIAWLPGANLLYSSDLIQRGRPGSNTFFMPMMLAEVAAAAAREGITGIDRVFGMHLPPTPWTEVTAAIAAARK